MSLNEKIKSDDKSTYYSPPSTYQMLENGFPSPRQFRVRIETIQKTTDRSSEPFEAVRNRKKILAVRPMKGLDEYTRLLICEKKPEGLIEHFAQERAQARPCEKYTHNFSVNSCEERLRRTSSLFMFSYTSFKLEEVHLHLFSRGFLISRGNFKHKFLFEDFVGVFVGSSSTISLYERDFLLGIPAIEDCFSLIGERQSIDLYTPNALLRYDLLIYLSWVIPHKTKVSSIPLTKRFVTIFTVKRKIRAEAHEKMLTVPELFMLAMISYLKKINDPKASVIQGMIQKKFSLAHRLLRYFQFKLNGKHHLTNEEKRIQALIQRRTNKLLKKDDSKGKMVMKKEKEEFITIKEYFKRKNIR